MHVASMPLAPPLKNGLTAAQMGLRGAFFSDMTAALFLTGGCLGKGECCMGEGYGVTRQRRRRGRCRGGRA